MNLRISLFVLVASAIILAGCQSSQPSQPSATPPPTQVAGSPTSTTMSLPTTTPAAATAANAFWGAFPAATTGECPKAGEWPLYYWRGPEMPMAQASGACPIADRYWTRRNTDWLGYATGVPQFSTDEFSIVTGEAIFMRGKNP